MNTTGPGPGNQAPRANSPPPAQPQQPPPAAQQPPLAPQQQGPPPGYGPRVQSKAFAVTSLVLGIVSLFVFGIVAGPLAIIFGALRLKRGSTGRGMAVAGFILGILGTIGSIILIAAARRYYYF